MPTRYSYFTPLIIIVYYSFHHTVDSEEESCNGTDSKSDNGTDSKSDSELSESESDVEREGLQEPPNFGCESEMESGSDIDENQTASDLNAFMDSTETSLSSQCSM